MTKTLDLALRVAACLEACGARYLVGGSLASGFAGEPRSTLDIDLVVELRQDQIARLMAELGQEFYFDLDQVRAALIAGSTFNFVAQSRFARSQLDRRLRLQLGSDPGHALWVYTPEDILLQKLHWYRLGGETSDRQWRDVMGIIQTQGSRLDREYLTHAAPELAVADLLDRALGWATS